MSHETCAIVVTSFDIPDITYLDKSETPPSLVLGRIRTHNFLIFGLTTKPSCLGVLQENSGLLKALKSKGVKMNHHDCHTTQNLRYLSTVAVYKKNTFKLCELLFRGFQLPCLYPKSCLSA